MPASTRRALLALPALALAPAARAQAPAWPARQVRLVVGFASGGANDIMARLLAAKFAPHFPGATFVVENRPGAGTLLAADHVARAAPDGYTILYASTSTLITSLVNRNAGINVPRDFVPIAMAQNSPLLLVSRPDFPAKTLAEVIALAKQRPLTISHPGAGGINHLSLAVWMRQAGIELTLVPYNGNQPSITALLRGDVDLASDSLFAPRSQLESGALRGIAITSARRMATHPGVPTFAETLPGYEVTFWGGLLAPKGTPDAILETLNRATDAVLKEPEVAERVRSFGADPIGGSRAFYAQAIERDWQRWGEVVRDLNLRPD